MNPFESYFCQHLLLHVDVIDAIYPTGWDYNLIQSLSCTNAADRTVNHAELAAMINRWLSTLRLFEPKAFYRYKTTNQVLRSFAMYQPVICKIDKSQQGKISHRVITFVCFLYFRSVVSSFSMRRLWLTTEKKPIYFFSRPCLAAVLFCHNLSVIFPHFSCPFLDLCILPK